MTDLGPEPQPVNAPEPHAEPHAEQTIPLWLIVTTVLAVIIGAGVLVVAIVTNKDTTKPQAYPATWDPRILPYVKIADTSDDVFARTMATNVTGTFNTMREAATRLNDGGRIVNFSTSVLHMAPPTYGVYVASKGAVEALTRVFAKELRGRAITCNAVAPGPVATALLLDGKSDDEVRQFAQMAPLERLGQPEDIAGVVAFLAGPDGAWVNGQVLRANGGIA